MSPQSAKPAKPQDPTLVWWNSLPRETRLAGILTLAFAAAAAALFWFVLRPARAVRAELAAENADLGAKLEAIHRDASRTQRLAEETDALSSNLAVRVDALVLEPLVNSLSESAAAKLRPIAARHDVAFTAAALERPAAQLAEPGGPQPHKDARWFVRQPVAFRATAGYWALLDFFADVAAEHPAATLVSLAVSPRADSADAHDVSFVLEWPAVGERPAAAPRRAVP